MGLKYVYFLVQKNKQLRRAKGRVKSREVFSGSNGTFNSTEIHGLFDNIVVVMQLQRFRVHRLVEGPGVAAVLLGE